MTSLRFGYHGWMDMRTLLTGSCMAALLVSCGSGEQVVSQQTADALHERVNAVRTALDSDRIPAARTAVEDLRDEIRRQVDAGELESADAQVLLEQAAGLAEGIERRIAPSTGLSDEPTPIRTSAPAPVEKDADSRDTDPTDGKAGKPGKGKGNGKAKGMRK